ncbi:SH3 domain-containing protein [Algoriphagus sp. D3-2-R+10]|uniref:SH3 domain-containing protein n=1 Tax=Algoriphagus aurantiacus TaxID=3103948 RepID=UPI002B39C283|nr:SH3 domain-containing protein [Algoriphagus sp. D3-2-R+10]MEB2776911.1 SH3 domain-containing protein [Algoriphagus sp. D3-2-R+10]
MPNVKSIFLTKLLIFLSISLQSIHCQADVIDLKKADSLFNVRSYKEAMEIYDSSYQSGIYSPAMLLKMAFITEGIGDKELATLYLSKYYDLEPNQQAITKIKSLTGQSSLIGYEVSDTQRFLIFLTEYQEYIVAALALFLVVSIILSWITSRKSEKTQTFWPTILLMLLIFLANNFLTGPRTGLITSSPTFVVSKPSAGGELIDRVGPGHRVHIKSSKDIWYEVDWKDKSAYIKKSDVTRM